jgi:FtsP/CotA-like multicopper oxidase with cupredoxin domain
MSAKKMDRRNFIKLGGMGATVLIAWPFATPLKGFSEVNNQKPNPDFRPDLDIELTAKEHEISLFQGNNTRVWMFEGNLLSGDTTSLQELGDSYLGPIIRVRKGQKIRIRFQNQLPEESIVHWHGMHVPEEDDGHPKDVIRNGETYVYEFEIMNRAGTYWFHPHPHGRTGPQVYNGLAGLFIVTDEEEQRLKLPSGDYDFPVVIQDRTIDNRNQLVYLTRGRMERMNGFLGNRIFINGKPDKILSLKSGCKYRLRILNGSNSRFYKLAWEDGTPLVIIGKDGSLLDSPKSKAYVMLGVAERIDVWLDLTNRPEGSQMTLKSLSFSPGMMGMMGGMRGRGRNTLPLGSTYEVLRINIDKTGSNNFELPQRLAEFNKIDPATAVNRNNHRTFSFFMRRMQWTINGRTWEMTGVTEEETVKLNTTEIWEIVNTGGWGMENDRKWMNGRWRRRGRGEQGRNRENMMGGGMQMPHPFHIHHLQFNVLERDISGMDSRIWNSVKDGFIDEGWQDTVLLMPGMKVKLIMRFEDFKGLFLYHCHNLEHEDMGMMRNFKIE